MRADRGKSRNYRDIDGVLILDKAIGCSSNRALQQVRAIYRARKAGHCGSLDPLATGVLPICLGQATRFSGYLLDAAKAYVATCRLGQTTTTGDAEGELLETRPVAVEDEHLAQVLRRFTGSIDQIPPMYSALKHQGQRLYRLAREGKQVEREPRRVSIFKLDLVSLGERELVLEVHCSKGTYIRTLAEDIGAALGCGAHLSALRRIAVGSLSVGDAVTIERLTTVDAGDIDGMLLPVTALLSSFPELSLDEASTRAIRYGKRVLLGHSEDIGLYRLVSPEDDFIGLGEVFANGELAAKRLMNTAT